MNRTDRLLAMVLELQRRGRQRAEDLARTFETSKRTIYRDIQALCEAGVPVIASPGQGYELLEGFFLPPVQFSPDEAAVLLLGSDLLANHFDATYRDAALAAVRKVEAVLPAPLRDEVSRLRERLLFVPAEGIANVQVGERLRSLRRAIIEHRTVRFTYFARHRGDGDMIEPPRDADPYGLVFAFGSWYLHSYCHRRNARRNFRLDRMEQVVLLDRRFAAPNDAIFRLPGLEERPIEVQVLFDHGIARWVREERFFFVNERERPDGLEVTLRVHREDEILHWLLGWGSRAHVLAPLSLRERVAAEAQAIVQRYQTVETLLT